MACGGLVLGHLQRQFLGDDYNENIMWIFTILITDTNSHEWIVGIPFHLFTKNLPAIFLDKNSAISLLFCTDLKCQLAAVSDYQLPLLLFSLFRFTIQCYRPTESTSLTDVVFVLAAAIDNHVVPITQGEIAPSQHFILFNQFSLERENLPVFTSA